MDSLIVEWGWLRPEDCFAWYEYLLIFVGAITVGCIVGWGLICFAKWIGKINGTITRVKQELGEPYPSCTTGDTKDELRRLSNLIGRKYPVGIREGIQGDIEALEQKLKDELDGTESSINVDPYPAPLRNPATPGIKARLDALEAAQPKPRKKVAKETTKKTTKTEK